LIELNPDLTRSNVDGKAGFTTQDQTNLIQFLLSLDDDPEVLPTLASNDT
jgi:hypothetical protein